MVECRNTSSYKTKEKGNMSKRKSETIENIIAFKKARAKARLLINNAKKQSWQEFISQLNSQTPRQQIWNTIRKITPKFQTEPIPARTNTSRFNQQHTNNRTNGNNKQYIITISAKL